MEFPCVICIWSLLMVGSSLSDDLTDRVSLLEKEVHELKSDSLRRNELIRLLALGLAELTGEDSDRNWSFSRETTPQPPEQTTEQKSSSAPVTILEVRRENLDSKVKLTVKYRPAVDDLIVKWQDHMHGDLQANSSDQVLEDGTRETSLLIFPRPRSGNVTSFSFSFLEVMVMVSFTEKNRDSVMLYLHVEDDDAVESDVRLPVLQIEPAGDLVYEDGKDIDIEVTTPPLSEDMVRGPFRPIQLLTYLLDPDTGEVNARDGLIENLEIIGNQTFPDHMVMKLKFKTSEFRTSGVAFVTATTTDIDDSSEPSSLILAVSLSRFLVVRPSTQDGPFPSGYISFLKEPWKHYDSDGAELEYCSNETSPCSFHCTAIGNDIASTELFKLAPGGSQIPLSDLDRFTYKEENVAIDFTKTMVVQFEYDESAATDSERFSCRASSGDGQVPSVAKQDIVVEYYVPLSIVKEESGIETKSDESGLQNVSLICRVRGRPQPDVSFTLSSYNSYDYDLLPDEVIELGNDTFDAIKYVTYDPDDPYNYNGLYQGKPYSAQCSVSSEGPMFGYDYFEFEFPDNK